MKKTVRTGIVGCGFSATFHYEALTKVYGTNVEVVGVFSLDQEGAAEYAKNRGIRSFESLEALLGRSRRGSLLHTAGGPRTDLRGRA